MKLFDWSNTPASNQTIDTLAYWPEPQLAATFNDSARGMMARIRAWLSVMFGGPGATYGGSGNAYTVTSPASHELTAYAAGVAIGLVPNATNTGPATVNVDTRGARSILTRDGQALRAGDLVVGVRYQLIDDGTAFRVVNGVRSEQPMLSDNRIINGRMEIDQRNAGAAVTVNTTGQVRSVDMYSGFGEAADGVFTLQQVAGGPPGFTHFLRATVTTADASIGASQRYLINHRIEGVNVRDLAWGTANAQAITRRVWVRSTMAGTFGASVTNSAANRSYAFSITINAANTWELKTITIPGDTSGTWLTDTGVGLQLYIDLGSGSTFRGTANTWTASALFAPTGSVSLISTLNATFDITGDELVRASSDLGPSWRPFADELRLCQRYYEKSFPLATAPAQNAGLAGARAWSQAVGASVSIFGPFIPFEVRKRATPTVTLFNPSAANAETRNLILGADNSATSQGSLASDMGFNVNCTSNAGSSAGQINGVHYTASAEL